MILVLECTIKLCTFPCQQSMCTEQSFSASKTSVARYLIQFNPLPCQDFCKAFRVEYNEFFSFHPETLGSSTKYSIAYIYWRISTTT